MKKPATLICLAVASVALVATIRVSVAAEPVDVFVIPVPTTPQGTNAAILSPGTYFAERSDGVRLSGWVHSPDTSRFPMLKMAPYPSPLAQHRHILKHHPGLRFVPAGQANAAPKSSSR